jgi:hypothetical protein
MTLYVSEHHGVGNLYRQPAIAAPLASYALSSASTGPFPSAGCDYVRVSADLGCYFCFNSTSTGVIPTATNSVRIAAFDTEIIAVSTLYRLQMAST